MLLNRYRIVSLLGQGGMGAVYRAWDTRLKKPVALKEMVPQPGLNLRMLTQLRQQFEQEAVTVARLKHNHLAGVTDFFEQHGNVYLVMEFVQGESLAQRIEREGSLSEEQVLSWAEQLLSALAYCHNQGIIHRDISPQNVIIRPDGQAVLVDFGLVKLWDPRDPRTRTAMRGIGKPEYAPPEQYDTQSGHTDPRSDIYSLGATLYHALTGKVPPTVTQRIVDSEALTGIRRLKPQISTGLEAAIMRSLELQPIARFHSAAEMARALGASIPVWVEEKAGERAVSKRRKRTRKMPEAEAGARPAQMDAAPAARPISTGRRVPAWVWGLVGLALLVAIAAAVIGMGGIGGISSHIPLVRESMLVTVQTVVEETATATASPSPRPTVTASPSPSPTATASPSPLPTATASPSPFPTATTTPVPTPTSTRMPTRTPRAPTRTPIPTQGPTKPPVKGARLDFPEPTALDGWEKASGGYQATIIVHISGGVAPFTIHHDVDKFVTHQRDYPLVFKAEKCVIVKTIVVESADRQRVKHDYYIRAPWCD
jgi:serine/threonine-protein kinase